MFGVLFDGFAYGMLLFLLSVGLSVTLGMMNFVNLAHCTFGMIGGYVTVTLMNSMGWPFLATLPMAFILRRGRQRGVRAHHVPPALPGERSRPVPADHRPRLRVGRDRGLYLRHHPAAGEPARPICAARFNVMGVTLGVYRLFLIGSSLFVTLALVLTLEYTRFGAQVRAAVDNQRMARGLGINVDGAFAITFALGSGLAGLGGALAIDIVGLDPSSRSPISSMC